MTEKSYKIDHDLIPYACYVDDHTIITKNGMLLQTVTFDTNIDNQEEFRIDLRDFIKEIYTGDIAMYFHTIKISPDTEQFIQSSARFEDDVIQKVAEIFNFTSDNQVSYNITFVTKIFKKPTLNILDTFKPKSFYEKHQIRVKNLITRLNDITDDIIAEFDDYNPRKLGIIKRNDKYEAEYMNFLGKLINFRDDSFELPTGGLCYSTNYSSHIFSKNKFLVRSDIGKRYAATFSLKEYSEISCQVAYQLLHSIKHIIISQVVIPINNKSLVKEYSKIEEIYAASTDVEFKSSSSLIHMTDLLESRGDKNIFAKSQVTVTVMADSTEELEKTVKLASNLLNQIGIVAFTEDVHLQNVFFSTIPGNFRFMARVSNIPIDWIAGFAYSEGSDLIENDNFMWGKVLLTLQTVDNKRYRLGMPLEQRNLLIVGESGSGRSILGNILSLGAIRNEISLLYIDTSQKGNANAILAGLDLIKIDTDSIEEKYYKKYVPFGGIKPNKLHYEYAKIIIKIITKSDDVSEEKIDNIISTLMTNGGSDFPSAIKNAGLEENMIDWLDIGKYSNVFDYYATDDAISINKDARLVIGKTVLQDENLRAFTAMTLLFKIALLVEQNHKKLIIINDVFHIFKTKIEAKMLERILKTARDQYSISFIFIVNAKLHIKLENAIRDVILRYTEHRIHFGNDKINTIADYKERWDLSSKDMEAIALLDKGHIRNFGIFTPYKKSYVKFELSKLGNILRLISDASGLVAKQLHEFINEGNSDRRMLYANIMEYLENKMQSSQDDDEDPLDMLHNIEDDDIEDDDM